MVLSLIMLIGRGKLCYQGTETISSFGGKIIKAFE